MSVRVRIPTPLRTLTNGQSDVAADGADVASCLTSLESQYPGISGRILEEGGEVKRFVNLFVNGEDIRFLEGVGTKLNAGDELSIVPAMAGGAW
jgi:molybdopterin synthase sulfur carrier subunit